MGLEAHDGMQWVPFRELFSISQLRKCYGRVVELDTFLDVTRDRQNSTLCILLRVTRLIMLVEEGSTMNHNDPISKELTTLLQL